MPPPQMRGRRAQEPARSDERRPEAHSLRNWPATPSSQPDLRSQHWDFAAWLEPERWQIEPDSEPKPPSAPLACVQGALKHSRGSVLGSYRVQAPADDGAHEHPSLEMAICLATPEPVCVALTLRALHDEPVCKVVDAQALGWPRGVIVGRLLAAAEAQSLGHLRVALQVVRLVWWHDPRLAELLARLDPPEEPLTDVWEN